MRSSTQSGLIWEAFLAFALLLTSCRSPQHDQWPLIKEVSIRHHFATNKESEQLNATIYGRDGNPIYCLDARFCWRDYETKDYDFSGALDCRLYPLNGPLRYPTLLQNTENATRDWQTYGRFVREELIGLAGADASRAVVQRCGVRGMMIEIEVSNVKAEEDGGRILSFDMMFRAKSASSPKERLYSNREIAARHE